MKDGRMATYAGVAGLIAGVSAIGGGLYAHFAQPSFGLPHLMGWHAGYLSGVHMLVGVGALMVIGGLLAFRWPAAGVVVVCLAGIAGLVYAYDRGQYHWTPLLYYLGAPWIFAWLTGIFGGFAVSRRVPQIDAPVWQERAAVTSAPAHEPTAGEPA